MSPRPRADSGLLTSSIRQQADRSSEHGRDSNYFIVPVDLAAQSIRMCSQSNRRAERGRSLDRRCSASGRRTLLLDAHPSRARSGVPDAGRRRSASRPLSDVDPAVNGEPMTSDAAIAASFCVPYAFTLLFVMSIFITSGYLLQSVTEEKENRVVEILLSSVPALPLMAGKVLGLGAAGLTQVAIWVATALVALPLLNNQFSARPSRSRR